MVIAVISPISEFIVVAGKYEHHESSDQCDGGDPHGRAHCIESMPYYSAGTHLPGRSVAWWSDWPVEIERKRPLLGVECQVTDDLVGVGCQ